MKELLGVVSVDVVAFQQDASWAYINKYEWWLGDLRIRYQGDLEE